MAANLTATAPPGAAVRDGPDPDRRQPGRAGHDVQQPEERLRGHRPQLPEHRHQPRLDRRAGRRGALHRAVLLRHDVVGGPSRPGCEAGADPTSVPPGVADTDAADTHRDQQPDRSAVHPGAAVFDVRRCPTSSARAAITCIDHPATIDLSQLASVLGAPAAALDNVPLAGPRPPPDHPQRRPAGVVERHRHPGDVGRRADLGGDRQELLGRQGAREPPGSGIGVSGVGEVPTNAYLWFQTLPGAGPATPGPVQTNCMSTHCPRAQWSGAPLSMTAPATTRWTRPGRRGGLRSCHLLRLADRHQAQPAHRRHGGRPGHGWLLACWRPTEASSPSTRPTSAGRVACTSTSRSSA